MTYFSGVWKKNDYSAILLFNHNRQNVIKNASNNKFFMLTVNYVYSFLFSLIDYMARH